MVDVIDEVRTRFSEVRVVGQGIGGEEIYVEMKGSGSPESRVGYCRNSSRGSADQPFSSSFFIRNYSGIFESTLRDFGHFI